VTVIEGRRPGIVPALAELWRYRRFTMFFGRGMVTKRYARTWLGVLWLPLRPILSIGTRLLVFGGLVGLNAGRIPYPVFFLLASAAWVLFSECLMWSTRSLDVNRGLLRRVHIPRLVLIVSAIVPSLVDFCITVCLAAIAVLFYTVRDGAFSLRLTVWSPFVVTAALGLIAMLGVGVGLLTASAGARARDVRFAAAYFASFAYYLTPVIYPLDSVPDKYKHLVELNPLTGAIELFKVGLFPGETISVLALGVTIAAVAAIWIPGLWAFQRHEVREW
jgi:lipopolysaccharide transport system permease protein